MLDRRHFLQCAAAGSTAVALGSHPKISLTAEPYQGVREKRIVGMRFIANTVCDLDLPGVEWTRKWIAEVGDEPLG